LIHLVVVNESNAGNGGVTNLLDFVDDISAVLPYEDVNYFFCRFRELGEPLVWYFNPTKTKILTAKDSVSPVP